MLIYYPILILFGIYRKFLLNLTSLAWKSGQFELKHLVYMLCGCILFFLFYCISLPFSGLVSLTTCCISCVSKSELFSRLQSVTGDGGGFDRLAWVSGRKWAAANISPRDDSTGSSLSMCNVFLSSSTFWSRFTDCETFLPLMHFRTSSKNISFFCFFVMSSQFFNKNRNTPPGVRRRIPLTISMPPSLSIFCVSLNSLIGISRPSTLTTRTRDVEKRRELQIDHFVGHNFTKRCSLFCLQ